MRSGHSRKSIFILIIGLQIFFRSFTIQSQIINLTLSSYNVLDFGAKRDGQTKDTQAIQKAIDTCYKNGGGTIYFPPGRYLSGSLHLKSNVALFIDHGATILASQDDEDFDPYEELDFENDADHETSYFHYSLLWGEDMERAAILGTGIIDGNRTKRGGPKPIAFKRCKHITIKDITILNAPNYAISLLGTDYVNIDGVSILNGYCDGIDPDGCKHVRISNCQIESYDDAIVPKASFSLGELRAVENLTVTNCILATNCNAFKLGTESGGGFKYITVSNCVMYNRATGRHPTSGIALETVDGGDIDGVTISNISMINVISPIFLRLGNRGRDMKTPIPGMLKNVIISNIVATGAERACPIVGIPDHHLQNVTLDNIRITFKGGGMIDQAKIVVPEQISKYPEATMFGELPSYGFYCRYVEGLRLQNISLSFDSHDFRHGLVCEDVSNLRIDAFEAQQAVGGESVILFRQVEQAMINGCMPPKGTKNFTKIVAGKLEEVKFEGNDFSRVKQVYIFEKD